MSAREILDYEARQRPRAAVAAALGAALVLVAAILSAVLFSGAPRAWFGEAVGRAADAGRLATQPSLQVPFYEFYDERSGFVLAGSILRALGWVATGWAVYQLAGSTLSRRPELPRAAVYLPLFGGALSALATLVVDVTSKLSVNSFLGGARTVADAQDVTSNGVLVFGQFLGLAGALAASLAFVLVSLNAMRAGLLTRFMGVLGIITGVLLIFPIGSPIPIVQCFWLGALALLFLGRWPSGMPSAWESGEARPWPSAAEARAEQQHGGRERPRGRERAGARAGAGGAAAEAVAATPAAPRRRKRKRRT